MSDSTPDDLPFRHYTVKHRIVSWISRNIFDNLTYTSRHGLIKGMKRKGGLGWLPEFAARSGGTPEQDFWSGFDFRDLTVYDVGAFQGLLTLFFSRRCRQVVSYEPNHGNHARLLENLSLNCAENVIVRNVGVGAQTGVSLMVGSPAMPGGASVEPETIEGLRRSGQPLVSEEITLVTLDDDIETRSLPAPDFLKIDIEGQELAALLGARRTLLSSKPVLFLEMHGETMNLKRKKVAAIVEYLGGLNYTDITHIETGSAITTQNCHAAAEGHLLCRAVA